MKITNCGIVALEKLTSIDKVSAYSLIQMARENGTNLLIYQVDNKDLMLVPRPVILHAKDHFIFVKNGEALPKYEYTGFVLSQKGFKGSRIVSYAEAKQVTGSKKGGFARQIVPIILAAAGQLIGIPAPLTYAATIGTKIGMDEYARSNHPDELGKPGTLSGILSSGVSGALSAYGGTSLAAGAQGGLASAQAAGKTGVGDLSWAAAKGAIVGSPGTGAAPLGAKDAATANLLAGGSGGVGSNFGSSVTNLGASSGGAAGLASGGANYGISGALGAGKQISAIGAGPTAYTPASSGLFGSGGKVSFNLDKFSKGLNATSMVEKFTGGSGGGLDLGWRDAAALAGSQLGKPDLSSLNGNQNGQNYSALRTYLGQNPLPAATQEELLKYVHTPLEQIGNELSYGNDRVIGQINKSFDNQIQQAQRMYAQAGQSFTNSSDFREYVGKINGDREVALREAQQELRDQNLGRAIQAKQFALAQGFQQNQYDSQLAMELAKMQGEDQRLKLAIETNNYNEFQNIIAKILYGGYVNQQSTNA